MVVFNVPTTAVHFDIIVPVYNSLASVRRCLQSVLNYSTLPFRLIVVNDASDTATGEFLEKLSELDDRICLFENQSNLGFLKTANRGLEFALQTGPAAGHLLLLNSDVMVTPGWLESFAACLASDEKIAAACPLSNQAENFSLPIPPGENFLTVASRVRNSIKPQYPDITTAIGFCMALRRSTVEALGLLDEIFERGYAEDTDYHFRILNHGQRVVLVDNCFVYHEGSASFQSEKSALIQQNRRIFDQRWNTIYRKEIFRHDELEPLAHISSALAQAEVAPPEYDVLFFLPISGLSGGIIVVYEILERLILLGLRAGAVVLEEAREIKMPLCFAPFFIPEGSSFSFPKAQIYVATHFRTLPYCMFAKEQHPAAHLVYLIQGYEGWFPNSILEYVLDSYPAVQNRIVVSKWLQTMLARWNAPATVIANGVDTGYFRPSPRAMVESSNEKIRALLMLRDDPQGSLAFARELLSSFKHPQIEFWGVGEASTRPEFSKVLAQSLGAVDRRKLAATLREVDVFIDTSMLQGFGLLGLEAMASGVATVLAETGGVQEYATSENSLLCPPGSVPHFKQALELLAVDRGRLVELKSRGRQTALQFEWDRAAQRYVQYFRTLLQRPATDDAARDEHSYLLSQLKRQHRINHALGAASKVLREELQALVPRDPGGFGFDFLRQELPAAMMEVLLESDEAHLLVEFYETAKRTILKNQSRLEIIQEQSGNPIPEASLLKKVIDATSRLK